jgi:DNA-binding transcriptional regulator YiaG
MATVIREFTPDVIREIREVLKLSQKDFAIRYGLGPASVARWENDYFKPSRHTLPHLIRAAEEAGFEVELKEEVA